MRDYSSRRTGFDRVLMAVAATFVVVSGSAAFAQSESSRSTPAELAIDAAVPIPEPANLPPPTINDFKMDVVAKPETANAPLPPAAKAAAEPAAVDSKPAEVVVTAPAAEPAKANDTAAVPASPAAENATAPAAAPEPAKPASTVAAADQPVADRLRELITAKLSRYFDRKGERAAVEKFYAARDYAPLWTQSGALTARGKSVIARLNNAGADGLNAADYPTPDLAVATTPEALAEAEMKLIASMFDYARQAQSGRMHWSQAGGEIQYPEHPTDPAEVLANISSAADASAALEAYNPPQKGFRDLKAKLAELRGETGLMPQPIAEGPSLKFTKGKKNRTVMDDPRVPALRARLNIADNADSTSYDATVAHAVRKFQSDNDLKADGILDAATVRAMNSPKRDRHIDKVIVNMERWRWLPRQLGAASIGNAYVMLNIPDFTLKVMHNDAQVWSTRVVVGQVGKHATPLLTETMKYITINPTWNVPPSIIYNEYLPALEQDPTVLDRMGLKMERGRDGSIRISQPPGEANALGRIRFNFPNKFLVYQHDTPNKNLFAKDERAFSHGCMRVQNPDQYAATLLNITMPNGRYTPERIRAMFGRGEVDLKFPTPIPVNITYQTAFVDDAGKLQIRKDIYGRDAQMLAVLRNAKGKNLEAVVARSEPSYTRPKTGHSQDAARGVASNDNGARSNPNAARYNANGARYASDGPSFFERLFGAPTPPPYMQQDRRRRLYTR